MTRSIAALRRRLGDSEVTSAMRRAIPTPLLAPIVRARLDRWSSSDSKVADARAQMRFLLDRAPSHVDLDAVAHRYLEWLTWRAERRWHPHLITRQRVEGVENVAGLMERRRPMILNFMHHGHYDGVCGSLARIGLRANVVAHPGMFERTARPFLKQHLRVSSFGGTAVSAAVGTKGLRSLLESGQSLMIASDVPGGTSVSFAGRNLFGASGAARLAIEMDAPVVLVTAHQEAHLTPFIRLSQPMEPSRYASAEALLQGMLDHHERAVLAWPEAADIPMSRWGQLKTAGTRRSHSSVSAHSPEGG